MVHIVMQYLAEIVNKHSIIKHIAIKHSIGNNKNIKNTPHFPV